jgi:hypothetical protein
VLDVLLLLAVTRRLLEGLDDEGRGGGNDRDGSLTVLDAELDSDTESFLFDMLIQNTFPLADSTSGCALDKIAKSMTSR